jgi:hypothetical protein
MCGLPNQVSFSLWYEGDFDLLARAAANGPNSKRAGQGNGTEALEPWSIVISILQSLLHCGAGWSLR